MVHRIHHSFFKSLVRIIKKLYRLSGILRFNDTFFDYIGSQIIKSRTNHIGCRSRDFRHLYHIIRVLFQSIGEHDNIDLCIREIFTRILTKHHGCNILEHTPLARTSIKIHLIKNILQWCIYKILYQLTPYLSQMFQHQHRRYIIDTNIWITSIIERHPIGHFTQFIQHFALCYNSTTSRTDIPLTFRIIMAHHTFSYIVWTIYSCRHPDDQNTCTIYLFDRSTWHIIRIDLIIIPYNIFQDTINLVQWDTFDRALGTTILFFYTNQYIATANVIKIISKGTYTMVY